MLFWVIAGEKKFSRTENTVNWFCGKSYCISLINKASQPQASALGGKEYCTDPRSMMELRTTLRAQEMAWLSDSYEQE